MGFFDTMEAVTNVSYTENGMRGYKTTLSPMVDMNFKISSYRNLSEDEIKADFIRVLNSKDRAYALRFLFLIRDAREGLGERRLFRVCMREFLAADIEDKKNIVNDILNTYIPFYGRFDDYEVFMNTAYEKDMMTVCQHILIQDLAAARKGAPISLLAKWMPSVNTSNAEKRAYARKFVKNFHMKESAYRKMLSFLRATLRIVERDACANRWEAIDYNTVPSRANLKYNNAFLRHDEIRRRDYLAKLEKGDTSVKMHGSVNFPHDIVHQYCSNDCWSNRVKDLDLGLESLWKNLADLPALKDTIVVRDGSGSMTTSIGGTKITALEVSTALAVYTAERLQGDFHNKFLTFSSRAEVVNLSRYTRLRDKLVECYRYDDCSNTNLENVFQVILDAALLSQVKPEEMPKQILIISDMEFDNATHSGWSGRSNWNSNVIEKFQNRYRLMGYTMPKLIFWNVNSRSNTIPCQTNENGVLLVSGFSPNVLQMLSSGEIDSHKMLIETLESKRYSDIPLIS